MSYFVWSIRNAFPLPMSHIPYDVISTGMCSFILCVICFTLSFGLRSFIRYGISFLLSGSPEICFLSCVDYVLFCLFDSECFLPSDLSYASYCHLHLWCVLSCYGSWVLLYLVQSDRVTHRCVICLILSCPPYVLFYPTCSMFYFTLSIRIAICILCVIMCNHVMSIWDMLFYSI